MPNITTADLQALNTPITGNQGDPLLTVKFDAANPLKPGKYVFSLQVQDDANNLSPAVTLEVTIFDNQPPKAVIRIMRPTPDVPRIPFGSAFVLSGADSTDDGNGTIRSYIWTRTQ